MPLESGKVACIREGAGHNSWRPSPAVRASLAAFCATTITDRLEQGVPLEDVQRLTDAAR
jgi:hypothetical protein